MAELSSINVSDAAQEDTLSVMKQNYRLDPPLFGGSEYYDILSDWTALIAPSQHVSFP